ncbi:MAG: hypothetical protein SFT68_03065 [Rickettsiaceae bacterium]|nr:hypothetical protein [Rickettsiaceae bacterium]
MDMPISSHEGLVTRMAKQRLEVLSGNLPGNTLQEQLTLPEIYASVPAPWCNVHMPIISPPYPDWLIRAVTEGSWASPEQILRASPEQELYPLSGYLRDNTLQEQKTSQETYASAPAPSDNMDMRIISSRGDWIRRMPEQELYPLSGYLPDNTLQEQRTLPETYASAPAPSYNMDMPIISSRGDLIRRMPEQELYKLSGYWPDNSDYWPDNSDYWSDNSDVNF